MSDLRVDLSTHTDKFAEGSRELLISKQANFIFGKNGTGKTTITNEILRQFSDGYDVCVFKDFDGVAENNRLNAVALGTENVKIQDEIKIIDNDIKNIKNEIELPAEIDTQNFFTKASKAKKNLDDQQGVIDKFYGFAAQEIKNINNPSIATTSYNRNYFKDDISKANLLSDSEIATYRNTIKADEKVEIRSTLFPVIDLGVYVISTNEVLASKVVQPQSIPELQDNPAKQNFAKQGMDLHEHAAGEVCAFCGNKIDETRWVALGNYFNSEVKSLESRIQNGITELNEEMDRLENIDEIDKSIFYEKFSDRVTALNSRLKLKKSELREAIGELQTRLDKKKEALFVSVYPLEIEAPKDLSEMQKEYDILVKDNNELSKNLKTEQEKAKSVLRYHEIKKKLDAFKYINATTKLETLRGHYEEAQTNLRGKQIELEDKQRVRAELILQTKDENKIAIMINGLLRGMGVASFCLEPVDDEAEDQKGQYQIKGHDGSIRAVTELSRGEKNIVAFLYFLLSLKKADGDNRSKIIILDDPMTSNDDTMQYLMIGEIQKLYRSIGANNYFVLFTHNTHFYLNVRPDERKRYKTKDGDIKKEISLYEKHGVYRLMSNSKHTTIKSIANGEQDFKTSYETLWKELVFLYQADVADLMLNPCRKICETYVHFIKKDPAVFYADNINAKKLFDVNQHAVDDLEAEQNGRTRDDIKNILYNLFEANGAKEHFNSYWKVS